VKINVSELLKAVGNKAKFQLEERLEFPKDELALISPVKADLFLTNTGRGILLEGTVKGSISLTCGRCLKEFSQVIDAPISEIYKKEHKHRQRPKKDEIELNETDFVFPIDGENEIDVAETIRQNLILALPIKVICSKDCKGLKKWPTGKEKINAATKETP